jgi:hypothetical protein
VFPILLGGCGLASCFDLASDWLDVRAVEDCFTILEAIIAKLDIIGYYIIHYAEKDYDFIARRF